MTWIVNPMAEGEAWNVRVKTKRRICGWIFGISLLCTLGACGSLECQTIDPVLGDVLLWTSLAVGTSAGYKGGYIWFGGTRHDAG